MLSATVVLSQQKFDALSAAIKNGGIRSAMINLLADLYHFGYEGMGAGMRWHRYNYAILCKDEGTSSLWGTAKGSGGRTNARLQELLLEWSPKLDDKTAGLRDDPDEVANLEQENGVVAEKDFGKVVGRLAGDVQAVRRMLDHLVRIAWFMLALVLLTQAVSWLWSK